VKFQIQISAGQITLIAILAIGVMARCSSGNLSQTHHDTARQKVVSHLGSEFGTDYNRSGTYALLTENRDFIEESARNTHYVVMRLADSVIVNEGSFLRGYVKWIDDNTLEKLNLPGKVQPDQDLSPYKKIISIDQPLPRL